ncbi:MAG: transcriptional regulator [Pseudomonadota bacterium]
MSQQARHIAPIRAATHAAAPATLPMPDKVGVDSQPAPAWWQPTPARIGFALAALLIFLGFKLPLARVLSPERGLGYALGIIGGSAMLLLLVYPARKRLPWLRVVGSVKGWFQFHMVLGVAGPLCILYHSNFSLGATNSNAALFAMVIVSASGIVGRYFYARIHCGLYGHRTNLAELQASAEVLRAKVAGASFVPDLLTALDVAERRLSERSKAPLRVLMRPITVSARMWVERYRLTRQAVRELNNTAARSRVLAERQAHFERAVRRYIARRLQATRQVVEFEAYEKLFSLWHVLHLPLFFMLLIAGVVHVVAVHVY